MTRDDLRRALEALPADASLTVSVAELREALGAPTASDPRKGERTNTGAARLLTPREVAERLGTSVRWVYDHKTQLGGRNLSRRCLRFPEGAVGRYLARNR